MKRLMLTVAMVAALAACSRSSATPAGVAEEFMRKLDSGNCTGLGDYLSNSSKAIAPKLEQACAAQKEMKKSMPDKGKTLSSVNVLEATENGDRATVRLEGVFSDGSKEGGEALTLVREDGRWKIDILATGMAAGAGGSGGAGPTPAPMTPPVQVPGNSAAPTMEPTPTPATPTPATPSETPAPDEAEPTE